MAYARATSLNGYWERMRRLLRMLGGDELPGGLQGVVIVGDSREPGATNVSYRRFSVASSFVGAIAALTDYTWRADVDLVIERVLFTFQTNATGASQLRVVSPAQVTAGGGVYNAVSAATGNWMDNPDGSAPPLSLRTGGAALGGVIHAWGCGAVGSQAFETPIYLPAGAAVSFYHPNNGITLGNMTLSGYVR